MGDARVGGCYGLYASPVPGGCVIYTTYNRLCCVVYTTLYVGCAIGTQVAYNTIRHAISTPGAVSFTTQSLARKLQPLQTLYRQAVTSRHARTRPSYPLPRRGMRFACQFKVLHKQHSQKPQLLHKSHTCNLCASLQPVDFVQFARLARRLQPCADDKRATMYRQGSVTVLWGTV